MARFGDGLPGEGFDLGALGIGEGVGEVEEEHVNQTRRKNSSAKARGVTIWHFPALRNSNKS